MKILILVLSTVDDIQIEIIKKTWASYRLPEIDIYFYYGKNDLKNTNNNIYLDVIEKYENMGYKTLKMFEYIKDFEFDYIFRTNTSSYINQEKLLEFIKDKPSDDFYCGIIGFSDIKFCSGCGYFLSKNIIKKILNSKKDWDHKLVDDNALGKILNSLQIYPIDVAKRLDIWINEIPYYVKYSTNRYMYHLDNITFKELDYPNIKNYYHFRCKQKNRNQEILIMEKLYDIFKNNM
jgi:hypothetical protein